MSSSVQPISSAAMSALIQELDPDSSTLFGDPFAVTPPSSGTPIAGGKLARVLSLMRRKVIPLVLRSMNTSTITVSFRSPVANPDDPLATRYSTSEKAVYAAVSGPTAETMAKTWTVSPDYEVLIAATSLDNPLDENDTIFLDGVSYDIVGIQSYPHTPPAVAYRFWLARAA